MKSGRGRVFRYSSRYETALPDGSFRRRMELHRTSLAASQRIRTPQGPRSSRDPKRRLLRPQKRLPVTLTSSRLSSMAHHLPLFQKMAHRRYTWERINRAIRERLRVRVGRDPWPSEGVVDSQSVKSTAVGGEQRHYDGCKKVKGSLSATSWWTPKASCSQGQGPQRKDYGLRGNQDAAAQSERALSPPPASVVGRGLSRRGQGRGLGPEGFGVERGARRASEKGHPRRGAYGMGQGVEQRGHEGGLAETDAPQRFCGVAEKVGGGEYDRSYDQNRRMSLGITRGRVRAGRRWSMLP